MGILFEKWEFLELFDNERILDAEIDEYEYSLSSKNFTLKVHLLSYDEYASVTLNHANIDTYIFNIGLEKIINIKITHEKPDRIFINFYRQQSSEPILKVMVQPTFSLQYRID